MSFPAERHPEDLKQAIGQALLAGDTTATQLVRDLEAGRFPGFDPYRIPLATVRYYGQQARKRERAAGLTKRAKGGINDAVESMTREILSEVDQELAKVRRAKVRDLEKLGAIAKLLKECKALAPNAGPTGKPGKREPVPVDPFAAALTGTARGKAPPSTRKAQDPNASSVETAAVPAQAERRNNENASQVPSLAPWS